MAVKKLAYWVLFLFGLFSVIPVPSEPGTIWNSWQDMLLSVLVLLLTLDMAFLIFSRRRRLFFYLVFESALYFSLVVYLFGKVAEIALRTETAKAPLIMSSMFIVVSLIVVLSDALILGLKLGRTRYHRDRPGT